MFASIASMALALQVGMAAPSPNDSQPLLEQVQYRAYAHPPPCGHGFDLSARDGLCYPNGYLAPQDQAARQYQYYRGYRGGRYYDEDDYDRRPRRRYYRDY
ncbi:hypothetical protein [Bradyrhizobium sp. AZCC 2289]|uniref:hypothetical protein n=1 Tax=Bradyrhizobium sp. AZCC 2289 TaxID=3117026 RepID=UPI002FEFA1FB